jgi:hypothetical protein
MTVKNHLVPELSVILVTSSNYRTISRTIDHLRAQTAAPRIELVIVTPDRTKLELPVSVMTPFDSYQVVEIGPEAVQGHALQAMGIRLARAPLVALSEDHSFPSPKWAQALIEAHAQGFDAVGPVVDNANPGSIVSWAGFLLEKKSSRTS